MNTTIEETKQDAQPVTEAKSPDGAARAGVPMRRFAAAPFIAITASIIVARILRRRRAARVAAAAAKPVASWSLSLVNGNSFQFHPVLAPRFGSLFLRGRGRQPRRRFR